MNVETTHQSINRGRFIRTPTLNYHNDSLKVQLMDKPTILIVDDEQDLADLYSMWLTDYMTLTAYNGQTALDHMNDDIDIVLLDRNMPDLSGDEVLKQLRADGYDCWVVMVTAVDPDVDIATMGFDDYITKPMTKPKLNRIVETIRIRSQFSNEIRQYFKLSNKLETLEGELKTEQLENSKEYKMLRDRMNELGDKLVGALDDVDDVKIDFDDLKDD